MEHTYAAASPTTSSTLRAIAFCIPARRRDILAKRE
jgi:hypothetical protein